MLLLSGVFSSRPRHDHSHSAFAAACFDALTLCFPLIDQVNSNRRMHPDASFHPKARFTLMHPSNPSPWGEGGGVDEDSAVVFANYNQLFKVGRDTFQAWVDIMRGTPNSVLSLLNFTGSPAGSRGLALAMRAAGVPPSRLRFSPFCVDKNDFLMITSGADLFLDNFFYNAGTTGSDVLYAGARDVFVRT